jgi:methionyl-tRNA synthetase
MKEFKRYTVTAALPYANGPKHIGHLSGAYIPADVYVRYLRSKGKDVLFVSGSDEHGTAIPNQALKENTTPRAIIDKYHVQMRDCFKQLGIAFDIYHRTSEPIHHQTSQEIFLTMYNKGLLNEEISEQYYDDEAKAFLADRYIVGTCPRCGHPNAYGDQCEKCGSSLSPRDLINPRSTLTGNVPVLKETKHWYLPLQKYEGWLREWILKDHADDWKTNVFGQCKSWIDAGLQPRAMTRDLDWGIKVPLPDAEGKVLYVWFDAPIGYISAARAFFQEVSSGKLDFAQPQRDFGKVAVEEILAG